MAWTDAQKEQAISSYKDGNPTPENSVELVKQIADELDQTSNAVRAVLIQAGIYKKKEVGGKSGTSTAKTGDKAPRVSKEDSISELRQAIEAKGVEVDDDILTKLTGKAAIYLLKVISA